MDNLISGIFSDAGFLPHGHCFLWQPDLLWLNVVSDGLITLAYFSIPLTLLYFVRRRADLKFDWMFICFAVFILACGTTHLIDIITVWYPYYWLAGSVKAITAMASIPTAWLLVKLVPFALAMPSPSDLENVNRKMAVEILERKRIEHSLHQKNLDLATLNMELEAFSYSVSHDLRAPLRSMDGFSLALLEDYSAQLGAEGQDALKRIRAASQRMGRLIDDLLRLSQVTRTELKREMVDLSALAGGIVEALQNENNNATDGTGARQVQWVIDTPMRIGADQALIDIVMHNLIENAWKFTSKTSAAKIHIGAIESADGPVYFVADNGAGFDMAYADQLFGAFQRLHHAADFSGTGIGLAIVQRIIHRHGGKIWVEAAPERGAKFFFSLGTPCNG